MRVSNGCLLQDVVIILREKAHERFVREGPNLHYRARIGLADALYDSGGGGGGDNDDDADEDRSIDQRRRQLRR